MTILLSLPDILQDILEVVFLGNLVTVTAIAGTVFAIVYLIHGIGTLTVKQSDIRKRLDEQQSEYEKMLKSDEQLREFRRDYKNHMLVVTAFLNAGKTEEASEYLDTVKVNSGIVGRQFSTGNFVSDAVLNSKSTIAEEFGIPIDFKGVVPDEGIENSDLCTVLSNLTDNAIEETKHFTGDKYVNIEASVRNGNLAVCVSNPVAEKAEIKNNRIKTTKSDIKNHGSCLNNVQRTVEKYGGFMLLSCSETEFCADVSMKLEH